MFKWFAQDGGFRAIVGNVALCVSPTHYAKGFIPKAARGSKWSAQCTQWDSATSTASRFGRDEYANKQDSAKAAKKLAESIYADEIAKPEWIKRWDENPDGPNCA